jgi:hypothetical protein
MTTFTVKTIKATSDLPRVFPEPMPFFQKGEFRRYKSVMMDAEWWDGSVWSRGATSGGSGLLKGIAPCERKHTDYSIEGDKIAFSSEFCKEEFSIKKIRHRKSIGLKDIIGMEAMFQDYLKAWNLLVDLDQKGIQLGRGLLKTDSNLARAFAESPFYTLRALKEYLKRRGRSSSPLRHKRLHRLNTVPLDLRNYPGIQSEVALYLKSVGSDLRRVVSTRLVRKSDKRFLVSFTFTAPDVVREVNLEDSSINFCRDPRLVDIGCSFSEKGLSIVVQNAFEDREFYTISPALLENVKNFLDKFFKEIKGKV